MRNEEQNILDGDAAIKLWRQGRNAWNDWINSHSDYVISFADVDFSRERDSSGKLSFSGFNFGNGHVFFSLANFGRGDVDFSKADFGEGETNFFGSIFGEGEINFSGTRFRGGIVNFGNTKLDSAGLNFYTAEFGDCDINFSNTTFNNCRFSFANASIDSGVFSLLNATFNNSSIDFFRSNFRNSPVNFIDTKINRSNIALSWAQFADLFFSPRILLGAKFSAQHISVKNQAIFKIPKDSNDFKLFDLMGASFAGPIFLSGKLDIIPDLRGTHASHQVELGELKTNLQRSGLTNYWPLKTLKKSEKTLDSVRLRRLKEIAETNKDHQAALRFSADENRARRWRETSKLGSILDIAFSGLSNYGQSILRPFISLLAISIGSAISYKILATATVLSPRDIWEHASTLAVGNSLPFLPQSYGLREDAIEALYCNNPSLLLDSIMIGQGVLSFIFLFLIGLGLRNRFRL